MAGQDEGDVLFEANGVVSASVNQVAELLLAVRPGPVGPDNGFILYRPDGPGLELRGGPARFTAPVAGDPGGLDIEVDRAHRTVAVSGQWWFRGETTVQAHPDGARVVIRARNVARAKRWLVPLVSRGVLREQPAAAEQLVCRIGERLGVATRME